MSNLGELQVYQQSDEELPPVVIKEYPVVCRYCEYRERKILAEPVILQSGQYMGTPVFKCPKCGGGNHSEIYMEHAGTKIWRMDADMDKMNIKEKAKLVGQRGSAKLSLANKRHLNQVGEIVDVRESFGRLEVQFKPDGQEPYWVTYENFSREDKAEN